MRYMTFPNSCAYCCVANMLETHGVSVSDRELVLRAKLPRLMEYDRGQDAFLAGAMLQQPKHFNLALHPLGFAFEEVLVNEDDVPEALEAHGPAMIGLKGAFGQHAMVFLGRDEGKYCFLNPHRQGDGQEDAVLLTGEELRTRLSEQSHIGFLTRTEPGEADFAPLLGETQETLSRYHAVLCRFFQSHRSREELMARRDPLLRPIALDWPTMMELAGETALWEKLRRFQAQVFALFQTDGCTPAQLLDLALLEEIFEEYGTFLQTG